jgi:hypothetical protein
MATADSDEDEEDEEDGKDDDDDDKYDSEDKGGEARGQTTMAGEPEMKTLNAYLVRFGLEVVSFCKLFDATLEAMVKNGREERLSKDLAARLIPVCGVTWNVDSRNRARDWGQVVIAGVLEPLVIQTYREGMLRKIGAARALRRELREYFLSIAVENATEVRDKKGSRKLKYVKEWCFADDLPQDEEDGFMAEDEPEAEKLLKDVADAYVRGPKGKKDPVAALVEGIEKCSLVHCSDSGVGKGVLETIVARCVSIIINVGGNQSRGFEID